MGTRVAAAGLQVVLFASVLASAGDPARVVGPSDTASGHAKGELFAVLPRTTFSPESLDLVGSDGRRTSLTPGPGGVFQASGLVPGAYALIPRYRGGIAGREHTVTVRAGGTTRLVPLPVPETAAVRLELPPEMCPPRAGARLVLRRLTPSPSPPLDLRPFAARPCRQEVQGLEAAEYEVALQALTPAPELLAWAHFAAREGKMASATLRPDVIVEGRVTFGPELPAVGVRLRFEDQEPRGQSITDEDGHYAASLPAPGHYAVSISAADGLPAVAFSRRLVVGAQHADFHLGDGVVRARFRREDGEPLVEPVQVTLIAAGGRRIQGVSPPGQAEARFFGLAHGEYSVIAVTDSGLTSPEPAVAAVSPQSPAAEVDLRLGSHEQALRVVDAAGAPVAEARASAGGVALSADPPGVFRLGGIAPAEPVTVRASGYVPVCRVLPDKTVAELEVRLQEAGEEVTIHFPPGASWEASTLLGLPGSDCAVSIDNTDMQARPGREETAVTLRLPPGSFSLTVGGQTYTLHVPGGDVYVSRPE